MTLLRGPEQFELLEKRDDNLSTVYETLTYRPIYS